MHATNFSLCRCFCALFVWACACGPKPSETEIPAAAQVQAYVDSLPEVFVDLAAIEDDFALRQQIHGVWNEREFGLECVVQKQGTKLTVVGLTPFGTKAFVLTQSGSDIQYQPILTQAEALPPEFIVADIHRSLLWASPGADPMDSGAAADPQSGAARPRSLVASFAGRGTGERSAQWRGERVTEHWQANALVWRSFEDPDRARQWSVEFGELEPTLAGLPGTMTIDNGWFGYRLSIRNLEFQRLATAPDPHTPP